MDNIELALFVIAMTNYLQHLASVCLWKWKIIDLPFYAKSSLPNHYLHSHVFLVDNDVVQVERDIVAWLRHLKELKLQILS